MLRPTYSRCDTLVADLDEPPPSQKSIEKLESFLVALLHDQIDFDEVSIETLDRCCRLASRVGLAMHKDLRRWCWSYDHVGLMEGSLPLQRIPDNELPDDMRLAQNHLTKSVMSKISNPGKDTIVDGKMCILLLSLLFHYS